MTDTVEIIKVNETFSYGSPIILLYTVNQKSKIILNYVKTHWLFLMYSATGALWAAAHLALTHIPNLSLLAL